MRAQRTGLGSIVVALLLTALTTVTPMNGLPGPTDVAGASVRTVTQTAGVAIELDDVSPWVDANGTWSARFRVTGAPADALLTYSIRQPIEGTEAAVRDRVVGDRTGDEAKVLQRPVSRPLAEVTDEQGVTRLDIPIRSRRGGDAERALVPNAGAYPIVVTVTTAARESLVQSTWYLLRLPVEPRTSAFRLGILIDHEQAPAFDDQGVPEVTDELRGSLAAMTTELQTARGLPVALAVHPEALTALAESPASADPRTVAAMRAASKDADTLRLPWADMHTEGWATGGQLRDVQTSLLQGQKTLADELGGDTHATVWPTDPTLGAAGVDLLGKVGVTGALVDPDRLIEARPPTGESGVSRPFRLAGKSGSLLGFSLDPDLQSLLASRTATVGAAPDGNPSAVAVAHHMLALMFATWLADDTARGAAIRIDDRADQAVTAALLGTLVSTADDDSTAGVKVVPLDELFSLPVETTRQSGRDAEWRRELTEPAATPQVAELSQALATARPLVEDYLSILGPGDTIARRYDVVVRRTLDRRVAPGPQLAVLSDAVAAMRRDLGSIVAPEPRTITVTSRNRPIPLRFTNGLDRPVSVRLRLKSPRLDFTDGDVQRLTLKPGINRLLVDVQVRTSGEFFMQAEIVAPSSNRVLASTRQRVRSRTFSGVGLALSGGALVFLVAWWSRTLRRERRRSGQADASH